MDLEGGDFAHALHHGDDFHDMFAEAAAAIGLDDGDDDVDVDAMQVDHDHCAAHDGAGAVSPGAGVADSKVEEAGCGSVRAGTADAADAVAGGQAGPGVVAAAAGDSPAAASPARDGSPVSEQGASVSGERTGVHPAVRSGAAMAAPLERVSSGGAALAASILGLETNEHEDAAAAGGGQRETPPADCYVAAASAPGPMAGLQEQTNGGEPMPSSRAAFTMGAAPRVTRRRVASKSAMNRTASAPLGAR